MSKMKIIKWWTKNHDRDAVKVTVSRTITLTRGTQESLLKGGKAWGKSQRVTKIYPEEKGDFLGRGSCGAKA